MCNQKKDWYLAEKYVILYPGFYATKTLTCATLTRQLGQCQIYWTFSVLNSLVCGFPEAGPHDRLQHIDSILKHTTRRPSTCLLNHSPKWLWTQFMDKECDRGIFGDIDPKYMSSPSQWSVNQWRQSCNIINHRLCHKCIHPPSLPPISGI